MSEVFTYRSTSEYHSVQVLAEARLTLPQYSWL